MQVEEVVFQLKVISFNEVVAKPERKQILKTVKK